MGVESGPTTKGPTIIQSALMYVLSAFGSMVQEVADGIFLFVGNAVVNVRLCIGGTTNAFPSLFRVGASLFAQLADGSQNTNLGALNVILTGVAGNGTATQIVLGSTTAATIGAAGGAAALPATPVGYMIINVGGSQMKVPYYNP